MAVVVAVVVVVAISPSSSVTGGGWVMPGSREGTVEVGGEAFCRKIVKL